MFFLGSTEATLSAIRKRMADDFPKTQVVGTYSPPFKSTYTKPDVDAMISAVNGARPDVLWGRPDSSQTGEVDLRPLRPP